MYCPQCKAEYRPGFFVCSDCRIDLVEELPKPTEEEAVSLADLEEKRSFGRNFIVAGIVVMVLVIVVSRVFPDVRGAWLGIPGFIGFLVYFAGCCLYAQGKGYSASMGIIGLVGGLGAVILGVLPEKRKA